MMTKKKSNPIVSVIVPTYNRLQSLPVTLESIGKQTFRDFEVIVVNDHGDSVADIIRDFSNKFDISYIEHEINKGVSAARNTGLRIAKGKYIAYLDDDDIYYPNHLETLVGSLESSGFPAVYTDAYRSHKIEKQGKLIEVEKDIPYSSDFDHKRIFIDNLIPISCMLHQKICLDKSGFFDENLKRLEDWDLWIRLSIHYNLLHLKKITCEFESITDSSSLNISKVIYSWESRAKIYQKYKYITKNIPEVTAAQNSILSDIIEQVLILGDNFINSDNELLLSKILMLQGEIKAIKESRDYKIGYYILRPLRILKHLTKTSRRPRA